jgi:predicted metal-dependent hydrolase
VSDGAGGLSPQEQALLESGVAEFNAGLFYACHDTLEELWMGLRGEARSFVQGLIQIAVGFYHLGNANHTGAARLLGRGLDRLSPYPAGYAGLDTDALRRAAERWRAMLLAGGPLPAEPPPSIGVGRRAG